MFGLNRPRPPAASAAVHVLNERARRPKALCGVDVTGEQEMPAGTPVTCPICAKKNSR